MSYGRLDPRTPILVAPDSREGQTVGDFWAWAYSSILTNITRGLFAEFLVGTALGALEDTRTEWSAEVVEEEIARRAAGEGPHWPSVEEQLGAAYSGATW